MCQVSMIDRRRKVSGRARVSFITRVDGEGHACGWVGVVREWCIGPQTSQRASTKPPAARAAARRRHIHHGVS
jgi:hypothetical protein